MHRPQCLKSHEPIEGCRLDPEKYIQAFLMKARHHFGKHTQDMWWLGDGDDAEEDQPTAEQMIAYLRDHWGPR